ncbi:hypothetical protein B0T17DRAFT_590048 [Bombardia bombarda]|uniref:MOZ protein represents a chromatin-associated acetyltransferase n=1 Tax=Bombardia bombarda TaxID=252184 RepID=A0AA40CAT5_9PEZI|nr:hypothetical protein B0T17DRAFT_590048 [Bombardia bombarda]
MATSRLTFLYPHLYRTTGRWSEPVAQAVVARRSPSRAKPTSSSTTSSSPFCQYHHHQQHASSFTTSSSASQAAFAKRAGKAVEPLPTGTTDPKTAAAAADNAIPAQEPSGSGSGGQKEAGVEDEAAAATSSLPKTDATTPPAGAGAGVGEGAAAAAAASGAAAASIQLPPPPPPPPSISTAGGGSTGTAGEGGQATPQGTQAGTVKPPPPPPPDPATSTTPPTSTSGKSGPMDTILHMGPPSEAKHKPPHLTPPPYVHHFDSYSLVKQLTASGYTQHQAITAMKAVRGLLASNLDVAQDGLVSKSDVENETYLFRAACSELSTEVRNNRRVADEQLRQQRTHLQHEVDILTQRLNQELLNLTDGVRGMFGDRRMVVREEQKAVDSSIQQLNYKISVMLNSDARSEIEALRWVLIRRSVLGIIFMAILTLGTLRYASYVSHERQKASEKRKRDREKAKRHDGMHDSVLAPEAAAILTAN